ncbi:MAG: hypothetical protein C0171_01690 [Caldisphaera sp.]|nr:MAG: hypothetical protein C0201_00980 [Caldisphaera sp.]PMP91996.1 MAG: hypothetical protein C0171_01690 [Caldisphaera sp.]
MAENEGVEEVSPEIQAQTLSMLLNSISSLKKSGLLGLINYLAEKSDDTFLTMSDDPVIMRLVGLLATLSRGVEKVDGVQFAKAKMTVEDLTTCAINAMSSVDITKPRKLGLMGLMRSLGDPDVSQGLGILLDIAKNLGACARSKKKE